MKKVTGKNHRKLKTKTFFFYAIYQIALFLNEYKKIISIIIEKEK